MSDRRHKLGLVGSAHAIGDFAVEPLANDTQETSNETDVPASSKRFGKYQLLTELGRGELATVYLAVAYAGIQDVRKLVAIKLLNDRVRTDVEFVERFAREARVAAELSHPNIVVTHTVGQEEGRSYVAMEYLEGVTLREIMKYSGEWPLQDRLPLFGAMCLALTGLGYVHDFHDHRGKYLGLVHRDVRPENIFITTSGQVKLLDYGLAKAASEHYLPPEAAKPDEEVDPRGDLFAAGVILAELATGRRFWDGVAPAQIMTRLAADELPSPELAADEEMPPPLARLLERALQPDPIARFQSALELRKAIQSFLTRQGYRVSTADLAGIVGHIFDPMRHQRDEEIRTGLAAMDRSRPPSGTWNMATESSSDQDDVVIPPATVPAREDAAAPVPVVLDTPPRSRTPIWIAVAAALAVVLVTTVWLLSRPDAKDREPAVVTNAAASTPTLPEPPPAKPAVVTPTPAPVPPPNVAAPAPASVEPAPVEPAPVEPAPAIVDDAPTKAAATPAPWSRPRTSRSRKSKSSSSPRASKTDDAAADDTPTPTKPSSGKKVELEPSPYTR